MKRNTITAIAIVLSAGIIAVSYSHAAERRTQIHRTLAAGTEAQQTQAAQTNCQTGQSCKVKATKRKAKTKKKF